eukprot:g2159.t1
MTTNDGAIHWTDRRFKKSEKLEEGALRSSRMNTDRDRGAKHFERKMSVDTGFENIDTIYAYNMSPKASSRNIRKTKNIVLDQKRPRWRRAYRGPQNCGPSAGPRAMRKHLGLESSFAHKKSDKKRSKPREIRDKSIDGQPRYMRMTKSTAIRLRTPNSPRSLRCRSATEKPGFAQMKDSLQRERVVVAAKATRDRICDVIESRRKLFGRSVTSIESVFDAFDANKDGKLTRDEFEQGLRRLDLGFTSDQINDLMSHMDTDSDAFIDLDEFKCGLLASRMKRLRDYHAVYDSEIRPSGALIGKGKSKIRGYYSNEDRWHVVESPDTHVEDLWPSRLRDYTAENEFLAHHRPLPAHERIETAKADSTKESQRISASMCRNGEKVRHVHVSHRGSVSVEYDEDDENTASPIDSNREDMTPPTHEQSTSARRGSFYGTYPRLEIPSEDRLSKDRMEPKADVFEMSPKHRIVRESPLARFKTMWSSSLRPEVYVSTRKRLAFKPRSESVQSRLTVPEQIVRTRKIENTLRRVRASLSTAIRGDASRKIRFDKLLRRMRSPNDILVWQDFVVLIRRICRVSDQDLNTLLMLVDFSGKDGVPKYQDLDDRLTGNLGNS